jgi:recombination protein U
MVNKISINRGMYLEEVINRTINYYISKKIIFIEKRPVPIQILKSVSNNTILGKLLSKSTVDYFGFYNSKHFEFETKETSQENFSISQILKHQ